MSRWRARPNSKSKRKDPLEVCGNKHTNATLAYHECLCSYDYRSQHRYQQPLKYKHCLLADEMRKMGSFQLYVVIAVVVGVVLIFGVAAFCSCKWYLQTNDNPCGCFSCCKKKKKKKKDQSERDTGNETPRTLDLDNGGQAWTPMRLVANKDADSRIPEPNHDHPKEEEDNGRTGICMNFCMSDPVQDCCEFFDCDIMWRKKSIYTIPIFGRKKQPALQRRPTRPAPPPPKPIVPPVIKYPEPMLEGYDDGLDCEPVPEAPPSPEPVRTDQPRAMYVDPLSFLQRPFLKTSKDKTEDEPDALYSKVKEFVFGKSKKSASLASLNKLGISKSPDAVSTTSSKKSKYGRTGSLASLHNLSDEQLDTSYHSKRSMSLASLHMVEEEPSRIAQRVASNKLHTARSRNSLHNICEDDDLHLSLKTDEYIDLEEMSKRIEAKMLAAQGSGSKSNHVEPLPKSVTSGNKPVLPASPPVSAKPSWTPNFIPASAYTKPPKYDETVKSYPANHMVAQVPVVGLEGGSYGTSQPIISPDAQYGISPVRYGGEAPANHYFPPVPATAEKPAIPARIAVGNPVMNSGTLGRPKPVVPPRPPGSGSNSPRPRGGANSPRPRGGANSPRSHGGANSPRVQRGASSPRPNCSHSPRSPGRNSPKPRAPHPPGTLGRHPSHVVKPSAPPPPPPVTTPIESSL